MQEKGFEHQFTIKKRVYRNEDPLSRVFDKGVMFIYKKILNII